MSHGSSERHVIIGAGPLGLAVLKELASRNADVAVITRSGRQRSEYAPAARWIAADAADTQSLKPACEGAHLIYHCVGAPYDRWPELLPKYMSAIIAAAASAGSKIVYGDNVHAYGKVNGPIHENLPETADTRKGRVRAEVAGMLRDAEKSGKVRAVIGRGSDFFGPHALLAAMGEGVFERALENKPANVLGDPDTRHSQTFIEDFGKALIILGESENAVGRTWHVPNAPAITTRQFVEEVFGEAGHKPRMRAAGPMLLTFAGLFNSQMRELKEMMYEFEDDFIVDDSAYTSTFESHATPLDEAISRTVDWYRKRS